MWATLILRFYFLFQLFLAFVLSSTISTNFFPAFSCFNYVITFSKLLGLHFSFLLSYFRAVLKDVIRQDLLRQEDTVTGRPSTYLENASGRENGAPATGLLRAAHH